MSKLKLEFAIPEGGDVDGGRLALETRCSVTVHFKKKTLSLNVPVEDFQKKQDIAEIMGYRLVQISDSLEGEVMPSRGGEDRCPIRLSEEHLPIFQQLVSDHLSVISHTLEDWLKIIQEKTGLTIEDRPVIPSGDLYPDAKWILLRSNIKVCKKGDIRPEHPHGLSDDVWVGLRFLGDRQYRWYLDIKGDLISMSVFRPVNISHYLR